MKIDVVASLRNSAIEPRAAAALGDISQRLPSLKIPRDEQRIVVPVGASGPADWSALTKDFAAAYAQWEKRSLDLSATFDATGDAGVATANSDAEVIAGWTPESGKLRDLNGSAANAALPKVLAGLAASTLESNLLESSPAPTKKTFRPRSAIVPRSPGMDGAFIVATSANRYAAVNARQGAVIAVVESARELACRGARPLGLVESVRIEIPATTRSFSREIESVRGVAQASAVLELGSLGGSVAAAGGAAPSVVVAAIGVIEHTRAVGPFATSAGARLVFLGDAPSEIGASQYLRAVHGLVAGDVPAVDFAAEQRLREVLHTLVKAGIASSARDISAGGLLSTICAMLLGGEKSYGALLDLTTLGGSRADALLFGESQGRAVITVPAERVGTVLSEAHMRGVSAALIGEVTESSTVVLKTRSLETEWSVATLVAAAS